MIPLLNKIKASAAGLTRDPVFLFFGIFILAYAAMRLSGPVFVGDLGEGQNWIFVFNRKFCDWFFPAPVILNSVFKYNLPAAFDWAGTAFLLLPVALAFTLGRFYSSSGALFTSLCAAAAAVLLFPQNGAEPILIISSCMALAACESFIEDKRSVGYKSLFSTLLCLLLQSKGVAFPVVLFFVFYPLFTSRRRDFFRLRTVPLAAVIIASSVWGAVNYGVNGKFLLFTESSARARTNICAGLNGLKATTEGKYDDIIRCPGENENIYLYFVLSAAGHPRVFSGFIVRRAFYLCKLLWSRNFLILFFIPLGFLSPFLAKRGDKLIALIWCPAVFLFFVHLLMPVQLNYFVPSLFLFAVLSGLSLSVVFPDNTPAGRRAAGFIFYSVSFLLSSLWLLSFLLMAVFPLRSLKPSDPDKLAERFPDNYVFRREAADKKIIGCDSSGASSILEDYYGKHGSPEIFWRHAQGLFLGGGHISRDIFQDANWDGNYPSVLYYALSSFESGEYREAAAALDCSLQLCLVSKYYTRDAADSDVGGFEDMLRKNGAKDCISEVFDSINQLPDRGMALNLRASAVSNSRGLLEPSKLFAEYEEDKNKECGEDPSGAGCLLGHLNGVPAVCSKFAPEAFSKKRFMYPEDFNMVGTPVCLENNSQISGLKKCFYTPPDFNNLQASLDICDGVLKPYRGNGMSGLNGEEISLLAEAEFHRANILVAMKSYAGAAAAARELLELPGLSGKMKKEAESMIKAAERAGK